MISCRELHRFQEKFKDVPTAIECLLVLDNANVPEDLNNLSIHRINVSSLVMKKLSGLQSTDSIDMVALVRIPSTFYSFGSYLKEEDCHKWFPSPYRILVLEGIQVVLLFGAVLILNSTWFLLIFFFSWNINFRSVVHYKFWNPTLT